VYISCKKHSRGISIIKENMVDIGRIRLYIRKERSPPPDGSEWFLEYELNKNN
jgi:hypothetical protein